MNENTGPHRFGRDAESAACEHLERIGYCILARNYRVAAGEIDIVARERETVVFVEVKARKSSAFGSAVSAVDRRKRTRMRSAAEEFLQFHAPSAKARFDVVSFDRGRMRLYRNAF